MPTHILATKLYIPPARPSLVHRARLLERLNGGLHGKVTLISAPAGFGKTTLLSKWIEELRVTNYELRVKPENHRSLVTRNSKIVNQVAWLSLDAGDSDPTRFLAYLVAALQTITPQIGASALPMLQSPQPPPTETVLTSLLNDISNVQQNFLLVLDDYHLIDSKSVNQTLAFLLEHLPPQMHLVIATREDPPVPLARLRARGQLNEIRATDLRFTASEAAEFLNRAMSLTLAEEEIVALDKRTEGWIAGLQLAALSMQGNKEAGKPDVSSFIQSFTGSHRFVMDYLVEEVLHQQPAAVQHFLLRTSILERMCAPLCEAVIGDSIVPQSPLSNLHSPTFLEYLEQANLFIIPLDSERRWYRYHHLFAELLRQRLRQSIHTMESSVNELHIRASQWYEENGLEIEAFHHAAAANDIERAERLIEGKGIPQHLRGAVMTILDWLASLPTSVLNARPSLWWRYASLLLITGQATGVEEKLQAAEDALQTRIGDSQPDDKSRNLIGRIATARAVLALTRYQVDTMLSQSRRALEYLHPTLLPTRANANWTLGVAYQFKGDRAAALRAHREAISLSQAGGDVFTTILATLGVGNIQEAENQLHLAAETYQRILQLAGDQPLQVVCEVQLGLARIHYEWNDLAAAEAYGQKSLHLARQYDRVIDRFIFSEVFLARLKLARGNVDGAITLLQQTSQAAQQKNFVHRIPEIIAAQVQALLQQGDLTTAANLVQTHELPLSQARVLLAQGNPAAALAILEKVHQQVDAKNWQDERLKVGVLEAVTLSKLGEKKKAIQRLAEALTLAEPGGFIRIFVDEGSSMADLLKALMRAGSERNAYIDKLLSAFASQEALTTSSLLYSFEVMPKPQPSTLTPHSLIEPLSEREQEVLRLIAQGLSNQEICSRLFLALSTVKGHNQRIFDKLQVQRRTEAIARARELGLV